MIKILDFYADWCSPCKMIIPILNEIEEDDEDIEIEKYNIEDDAELVEDYNIRSVPTLIFIKDDEIICRHVGSLTKDKLINILDKVKNS